jgi:hypothetical protein
MTSLVDGPSQWLIANMGWFRPAQWARFLPRRAFPAGAALELLGLCRCLRTGPRTDHTVALGAAAQELGAEIVDSAEFREGLYRCDHVFTYHLYLLALVHTGGHARPDLIAAAGRLVQGSAGVRAGALRSVQELVELRYVLDVAGIATELPPMDVLVARSALASGLPAAPLTDNEVYALTHLLFYTSDFGAGPAPATTPTVPGLVRALIGVYSTLGDLDLLAELLLCASVLGICTGPGTERLAGLGWRSLERGLRPDGSLPGPLYDPCTEARLTGEQRDAFRFGTSYHTTIVAAMAATARERCRVRAA